MRVELPTARRTACRACGSGLDPMVDFGVHPVANHYLTGPDDPEEVFRRRLCVCPACALIQMGEAIPPARIRSPHRWIRYEEPESHLDRCVEDVLRLLALGSGSHVVGLTYKDATLVRRFRERVAGRTTVLEIGQDFGDSSPEAGIETIIESLSVERAANIAGVRGKADLLVVRHVIEHADDIGRFAEAMKALLAENGAALVEIPDFSVPVRAADYCSVWEEHYAFFTPETLASTLATLGFQTLGAWVYPYPFENSVTMLVAPTCRTQVLPAEPPHGALEIARAYANCFRDVADATRDFLGGIRDRGKTVMLFGAGHLSCNFINLLGLANHVDWIIDDDPNKCGLFLPGSHLPIRPSSSLAAAPGGLCLLSVKAETQPKIVAKHGAFLDGGGTFASIFPDGSPALRDLFAFPR